MFELSEYKECRCFYEWVQLHPIIAAYMIKHVNEGKRSKFGGYCLKLIGMREGLPDYQLPLANERWNGLWIEMKRKGHQKRKKNPMQDHWIQNLIKVKQYATYAYGWEHASQITLDYIHNRI